MNRLGIFCFFNKEGKVNEYVKVLLNEMVRYFSKLYIVCNGKVSDEGRETLKKYSEFIYERDNVGFDAGAYKYAFTKLITEEDLKNYDAVLIFNDTFYGPFKPINYIFEEMESRNCDIWGLTAYNKFESKNRPYHIQSFFVEFMQSVISSGSFIDFWKGLDINFNDFFDCVNNYEMKMTSYFEAHGYSVDSFITNNIEGSMYLEYPYEIFVENNCPIIKKKCFTIIKNYPRYAVLDLLKLLEYVSNKYGECDWMYDDILRTYDIIKLKNSMQLNIVCTEISDYSENNISIYCSDENDLCKFENLGFTDIYSEEKSFIDRIELDDDIALVFSPLENKAVTKEMKDIIFDSIVKNKKYVADLCKKFNEHAYIGCILPRAIAYDCFNVFENEYISYGCFWIRKNILKAILKSGKKLSEIVLMRGNMLALEVQKYGGYTYTAESITSLNTNNAVNERMWREMLFHLRENFEFTMLEEIIEKLHADKLHRRRIKNIIKHKFYRMD
ncbi:rhamnan synthesis F family protein [Lachnospiraceae bacterium C1.1]|nr:rhamnan synthesis F family protein [Lachnospiraceae bacterium C1.1]